MIQSISTGKTSYHKGRDNFDMAETIKRMFQVILRIEYPRSIFDMSPGGLRYKEPKFSYPSTEEAWRIDAENIHGDFTRAISKLNQELNV